MQLKMCKIKYRNFNIINFYVKIWFRKGSMYMKKSIVYLLTFAFCAVGINMAFAEDVVTENTKTEQMKEVISEKTSETAAAVKVGAKKAGNATVRGAKKVGDATAKEAKKAGKATARGAKKAARATARGINHSADKVNKATERYIEKTTNELGDAQPKCNCGCAKENCNSDCECK